MSNKVKEKTGNEVAQDECRHYWIIEMANGPKSRGVCKNCGKARDFLNTIPEITIPKRRAHPLDLPEMPDVEINKDSKS